MLEIMNDVYSIIKYLPGAHPTGFQDIVVVENLLSAIWSVINAKQRCSVKQRVVKYAKIYQNTIDTATVVLDCVNDVINTNRFSIRRRIRNKK